MAAMASDQQFVTVTFTDGHRQRWELPDAQTPDEVQEELRQVIAGGQWFRLPGTTKVYSPYAIVAVEVGPDTADEHPSIAHRLGEVVGDAISPSHDPAG